VTIWLALAIALIVTAKSFLSGPFGMAGGLILIGALLAVLPVPAAMVLHAVTQIASNAWHGLLWREHVRWPTFGAYVSGCSMALAAWSFRQYVPSKPVAFILLGVSPSLVRLAPDALKGNPESHFQGALYGASCMSLMLLTGVAGPLLDAYFLGGTLDRREIVATEAMCQIIGHGLKLVYFSALIEQATSLDPMLAVLAIGCSLFGTILAKPSLMTMSEKQFRLWAGRPITTIVAYYFFHGAALLPSRTIDTAAI